MPVQLRKRLNCHYCGKRSNYSKVDGRKFKCQHCLAVNFLDENGEIADVPPEESEPSRQYARPASVEPPPQQSSIFCATCLKNQQLYTSALSEFLPDPDDPFYEKCEAALPAFKKDLEARYPQCCARCEPKVRVQLQQATYNARSDHIRRVLERSRARRIAQRLGWRSLVISGGALAYTLSLLVQLAWHFIGAVVDRKTTSTHLGFGMCLLDRPLPRECLEWPGWVMPLAMAMMFGSCWWNPKWHHHLQQKEGRLSGLGSYYIAQGFLMVVRLTAWVASVDLTLDDRFQSMLHSVSLIMILMIAAWSNLSLIKVDASPIVNWNQTQAPLVTANQFVPLKHDSASREHDPHQQQQQQQQQQPLSIHDLLPAPQADLTPWQPPSISTGDDSMDWTPSQTAFQPQPKKPRFRPGGPTPFHGTLPAVPDRVFGRGKASALPVQQSKQAIGLPPGFFDKPRETNRKSDVGRNQEPFIAQPKFFPQSANADTGLESIFGRVFSLRDPSADVQQSSANSVTTPATSHAGQPAMTGPSSQQEWKWSKSNVVAVVCLCALFPSMALWFVTDRLESSVLDYVALGICILVPLLNLIERMVDRQGSVGSFSGMLFALEVVLVSLLTLYRQRTAGVGLLWDKVGPAVLSLMIYQELYLVAMVDPPRLDDSAMKSMQRAAPSVQNGPAQSQPQPVQNPSPFLDGTYDEAAPQTTNAYLDASGYERRDSIDSDDSIDSVSTTSTVSACKTPKPDTRNFNPVSRSSKSSGVSSFDIGGLSLGNSYVGSGSNIAGSRTRTPRRQW